MPSFPPLALAAVLATLVIHPARAAEAEVRLLIGAVGGERIEAGLEIVLPPGWKTYWRTPGDAGIPPTIDASASRGLARFEVAFPAPVLFEEAGLTALGYTETVILPLDVRRASATGAADLDLAVQIGLCHEICLPLDTRIQAHVAADRPADTDAAARIAAARARVPVAATMGTAPEILSLRRIERDGRAEIEVEAAMPEGGDHDLLVEGPTADWALPVPERRSPAGARETWAFAIDGVPKGADIAATDLRFTLLAGDRAVEQWRQLDGAGSAP